MKFFIKNDAKNLSNMIDRIQQIIKLKSLSPSLLADQINVQRSSISHILSGRNKPSLDLVQKILSTFPDINSEWLLTGKGKMIKSEIKESTNESEKVEEKSLTDSYDIVKSEEQAEYGAIGKNDRTIEKIIIFYKDQTFDQYDPKK